MEKAFSQCCLGQENLLLLFLEFTEGRVWPSLGCAPPPWAKCLRMKWAALPKSCLALVPQTSVEFPPQSPQACFQGLYKLAGQNPFLKSAQKESCAGLYKSLEMWDEGPQVWARGSLGEEGKGRDSAHWPGLVYHVWPRTLRGV